MAPQTEGRACGGAQRPNLMMSPHFWGRLRCYCFARKLARMMGGDVTVTSELGNRCSPCACRAMRYHIVATR